MTIKNKIPKIAIVTTILILTLTFNTFLVQAAAPAITLTISGNGDVVVTATTNKGKVIDLGSFSSSDIIKVPGNIAYVDFELKNASGHHVSSVQQDGNYIAFGDDNLVEGSDPGNYIYRLFMILKQHTVEVTFSLEGTAIVPANTAATVFLGSTASLSVDNTGNPVSLTFLGGELPKYDLLDKMVWNITTNQITGVVTVTLRFTYNGDPRGIVKLYRTDLDYPNADVNGDNQINSEDVGAVANINPGTELGDPDWDPILDINGDSVIDSDDVTIVSHYNPLDSVWVEITPVDYELIGNDEWLISGETDTFSIFRCR